MLSKGVDPELRFELNLEERGNINRRILGEEYSRQRNSLEVKSHDQEMGVVAGILGI